MLTMHSQSIDATPQPKAGKQNGWPSARLAPWCRRLSRQAQITAIVLVIWLAWATVSTAHAQLWRSVAPRSGNAAVGNLAHASSSSSASSADWSVSRWPSTTGDRAAIASPAMRPSARDRGSRLWVVSTREAPNAVPPPVGAEALRYWRHEPRVGWFDASLRELVVTSDPSRPTVVWVHGNRIDVDDVMPQAIDLLRQLDAHSGGRSFRLVVWSWPSGRIPGPLADVRIKATRSECQSFYLGAVLAALPPETPIGLIGFSYGARLISGSLHLLGGGTIESVGLSMRPATAAATRRRAVLMAAALDDDWLLRGHRYERAIDAVQGMLVFANPADPVLRLYPLLYPGADNPQALGAVGLAAAPGAPERAKVYQIDAAAVLGPVHSFRRYIHAPQIIARTTNYVLFD